MKAFVMHIAPYPVCLLVTLLTACSLTQNPVAVSEGGAVPSSIAQSSVTNETVSSTPVKPVISTSVNNVAPVAKQALQLSALSGIAKAAQKNAQSTKKYVGETLQGQAKFIKAPKGNPNAVVADVRVTGLGEVSLWCRNVLGVAPAGRVMAFEGTLTGSVYTSEDFSHDVTMKYCPVH
ncbi:MAG: hypothetical protein ACR2IJ_06590 [Fluviibacter sp.]